MKILNKVRGFVRKYDFPIYALCTTVAVGWFFSNVNSYSSWMETLDSLEECSCTEGLARRFAENNQSSLEDGLSYFFKGMGKNVAMRSYLKN